MTLVERAQRNLLETYVAIGAAGPDAEVCRTERWAAVRSPHLHPISNFAVALDKSPETLSEIAAFSTGRPIYLLYTFGDAEGAVRESEMAWLNLRHHHVLAMLAAPPTPDETDAEIHFYSEPSERIRIARFMTKQFFPHQPADYREIIAVATEACGAAMARVVRNGVEAGAAMILESHDLAGVLNLCVDRPLRGQGFGMDIVAAIRQWSAQKGIPISLQCEPRLTPWYERQGLALIGKVEVWTPEPGKAVAIMK